MHPTTLISESEVEFIKHSSILLSSMYGIHFLWDLSTLFLYAFKIRMFTKYTNVDPKVFKRIMGILHKIAILTLFYEIIFVVAGFIIPVTEIIISDPSTVLPLRNLFFGMIISSISSSMYLMMDHNKDKYHRFLQIIYSTKMYYVCCCCKHMVTDQLNQLDEDLVNLEIELDKGKGDRVSTESKTPQLNDKEQSVDTKTAIPVEFEINIRHSANVSKLEVDI